jgi:hypothetical protein
MKRCEAPTTMYSHISGIPLMQMEGLETGSSEAVKRLGKCHMSNISELTIEPS